MATSSDSSNYKGGSTTITCRTQGEQANDYRVVVFGSAGVGKSSLVLRFVKGTFKETYVPTIEDTYRQVINFNKQVCTLQITDTTGSHQFPAMQRLHIQKGHAFILVYSITNRQSLEELKPIYKDILDIKGKDEIKNIPIMLVGSKCDENSNRDVPTSLCNKLAQEWQCRFIETSAKNNVNVKEAFQELLDSRNNSNQNNNNNQNGVNSNNNSNNINSNILKSRSFKKIKKSSTEKTKSLSPAKNDTQKTNNKKCVIS